MQIHKFSKSQNQLQSWKNGLGKTLEIFVVPQDSNFHNDLFQYRLSTIHFEHSCRMSLFPDHEIVMVPFDHTGYLHHHDLEQSQPLQKYTPYQYSGKWTTSCKIDQEMDALVFMFQSSHTAVVNVERMETGIPASLMSSGDVAIVYVLQGSIKMTTREQSETNGQETVLEQGSTMQCETKDPTEITMIPIQDAVVAMIQLSFQSQETNHHPRLARTNTGSVIMFDETIPFQRRGSRSVDLETKNPVPAYESAHYYTPPSFMDDIMLPPPQTLDSLELDQFPKGKISTTWINIMKQGLAEWIRVPVIIAKGEDGPIVGITAVVHGNELNGVPCIHRVISEIDVSQLKGCVVAIPCVNTPGYLNYTREFSDGKDLNRSFPGKVSGTPSQSFNHGLFSKIITRFEYLIDLHTASFGRINSYYVRADMNDPTTNMFAKLQQPQIILHNSGQDGTLRSAAAERGIKSITVEIGNPQLFQHEFVVWSYHGVMRILGHLGMYKIPVDRTGSPLTILCSKGFWIYTNTGGVLEVYPPVNSIIKKGDVIARIKNIFGSVVSIIHAPCTGIVKFANQTIGKSSNPVAMAGDRVLHLGIIKKENEVLEKEAKENY